ncbi:transposase family protein [Streptomyces sp. NPDC056930]|uniref:transposase family protein n=1 Tax=Streptomyces sp. NPDC056930 TaxID=3345967 RepID=UPI00362A8138
MESSPASRLSHVPDRRKRRGRRHRLVVVLVLTACATLVVGNDSITAIGQWADVLAPRGHSRSGSIAASTAAWSSVSTTSHWLRPAGTELGLLIGEHRVDQGQPAMWSMRRGIGGVGRQGGRARLPCTRDTRPREQPVRAAHREPVRGSQREVPGRSGSGLLYASGQRSLGASRLVTSASAAAPDLKYRLARASRPSPGYDCSLTFAATGPLTACQIWNSTR